MDDIRYDLNHMIRNEREKRGSLNSVMEQLALTDYEEIRERLEHCIERLEKLPSEIEASVTQSSHLETKRKQFIEKLGRQTRNEPHCKNRENGKKKTRRKELVKWNYRRE